MGAEHATSYTADGPSNHGFRTGGARITTGAELTGTSKGLVATGKDQGPEGTAKNGIGVNGVSLGADKGGISVGVLGQSMVYKQGGKGVRGFGNIGVEGSGINGPGGVFDSNQGAQINLVPRFQTLPLKGELGDLIVIRKAVIGKDQFTFVELWLCTKAGDDKYPAYWREVQLGQPVQAK